MMDSNWANYKVIKVLEQDTLLKLDGNDKPAYRCTCGSNVFREVISDDGQLRYRCNGCGDTYWAERGTK
jgi:transposase-like protein